VRPAVVAAFALLVRAAACGGGSAAAPAASPSIKPAVIVLPSQVLGLRVVREDVAGEIQGISSSYLDSLGLFSFREKSNLLRGTLQVGHFNKVATPQKLKFRDAIIAQLGSTVPVRLRVGTSDVWLSSGTDQAVYTWFSGDSFYVLSVRSDYPFQRTLLRDLMAASA
jgi:hypothetical protein